MVDEPSMAHYQLERSLLIKARCDFRSTIALWWHLAILLLLLRHLALWGTVLLLLWHLTLWCSVLLLRLLHLWLLHLGLLLHHWLLLHLGLLLHHWLLLSHHRLLLSHHHGLLLSHHMLLLSHHLLLLLVLLLHHHHLLLLLVDLSLLHLHHLLLLIVCSGGLHLGHGSSVVLHTVAHLSCHLVSLANGMTVCFVASMLTWPPSALDVHLACLLTLVLDGEPLVDSVAGTES